MQTYTVTSVKTSRSVEGTEAAFLAALADDAEYQPAYGVDVSDEAGNTLFSTNDLSDRLADLQTEAIEAGDAAQVALCVKAIDGDAAAVAVCVKAMADAAAQID